MSLRASNVRPVWTRTALAVALGALPSAAPTAALESLPDWDDEQAAYASRGLAAENAFPHIADGRYSADRLDKFTGKSSIADIHGYTEGDDLWTAYHMHRRLSVRHPDAAAEWLIRAQNLAGFFTDGYVGGEGWRGDASYNHDHIYGWGLCNWAQGEDDAAAAATVGRIIEEMIDWNAGSFQVEPGDTIFNVGTGGRRWGRQLRLAACAAALSAAERDIGWRDKVVDIMLQAPDWDPTYNMYWLAKGPTNSRLGSDAYDAGDRIAITYHMGIWMDALWKAWEALHEEEDPRAGAVRERIIDMATFYRDIPVDGNGFLQLNLGYNIVTGQPINTGGSGSPDGVYSISPVNGLVYAYKFTQDSTYLDRAWALYSAWQADQAGSAGTIEHYVDSEISSAGNFSYLANNKGELQYVYALFENGGDPTPIPDPDAVRPRAPVLRVEDQ